MTTTDQHIDDVLIPILESVSDPEIPVLSIMDMGVARSAVLVDGKVKVEITPTYSGCPAMDVIGDDIKKALKDAGYEVVANFRSNSEAAKSFEQKTGIKTMQWDVSSYSECEDAIAKIQQEFGQHISILVNNAGVTADGMLHKTDIAAWQKVIDTNLSSCFNMSRGVIEKMREHNFGRIISISSINALAGQLGQTNYSSSKAGIIGFTKALALESARKGITVNAIAPGYIATDMVGAMPEKVLESIVANIPVGRLGAAEEIARAVLFLVDDKSGFITGETMSINGGQYMQ